MDCAKEQLENCVHFSLRVGSLRAETVSPGGLSQSQVITVDECVCACKEAVVLDYRGQMRVRNNHGEG